MRQRKSREPVGSNHPPLGRVEFSVPGAARRLVQDQIVKLMDKREPPDLNKRQPLDRRVEEYSAH